MKIIDYFYNGIHKFLKDKKKKHLLKLNEEANKSAQKNAHMRNIELAERIANDCGYPELTIEDIKRIDDYWAHYGIKFSNYSWFRVFYGSTGINDPRFIPNDLYTFELYPLLNRKVLDYVWNDKNFYERFLPDVRFPKTIIRKINNCFYDSSGNYYNSDSMDELYKLMLNEKEIVIKNSLDSMEGRSVSKHIICSLQDAKNALEARKSCGDFLIQSVIHQHKCFSQFNESSVNIIRINSLYIDGKTHILQASMRFGTPGFVTDICFIDGKETINVIGINIDTGRFHDRIFDQDGKSILLTDYISNPILIVPKWNDIVKTVINNHPKLPYSKLIGWDFTVNDKDDVICMEYNTNIPGGIFYQYCNGPFFGEYTEAVLDVFKDKCIQKKIIPDFLRA